MDAFQSDAFQQDAFQIDVQPPVEAPIPWGGRRILQQPVPEPVAVNEDAEYVLLM